MYFRRKLCIPVWAIGSILFQENDTPRKEPGIPLVKCLPKIRCSVETVRKCQLVYYAYNYKKVDERGFKVSVLPPLSFLCLL